MAAVANCLDRKIIAGASKGLEKTWSLYKNAKEGAGSAYQKAKTVKEGAGLSCGTRLRRRYRAVKGRWSRLNRRQKRMGRNVAYGIKRKKQRAT
nr:hypothetical protein [Tanacetum cinerariifolium]